MRILITGSKGLIGSALKQALQLLFIDVIGLDKKYLPSHPECGDVLNRDKVFSLAEKVEGIVHFAAVSRVIDGEKNPSLCWKTNVEGTQNVVEAALASEKKPWVLYASSREVYGQQNEFPVKETASLSPVNIYGESKMAAEQIMYKAREKGLQTAIVRFSNVFGSIHDHEDRVVPAFCLAAVEGRDIRIDGKDHLFDFTYIEDVIQGVISLIYLLISKKESLLPVHLTKGMPVSLGQIAEIASKASEHQINFVQGVSRSFDVAKFWGDISRAKEMLNWKAHVSVEEGMHRLINQYRLFYLTRNNNESSKSNSWISLSV